LKHLEELQDKNNFEQHKAGIVKIKESSPFYPAIENNFHGLVHLLLSKGFDSFLALSESLKL
jgi:hypothetical protein